MRECNHTYHHQYTQKIGMRKITSCDYVIQIYLVGTVQEKHDSKMINGKV